MNEIGQQPDGTWSAKAHGVTLKSAFQPIFALRSGKLRPVACEGLLRIFSDIGRVSPGAYFSALDEDDLAQSEALARTLHIRNARTLDPSMRRLFLNFDPTVFGSPAQFEATLNTIGRELSASGIQTSDIVCEITEQAVSDADELKNCVYGLRARGYVVAVDDFGAKASNPKRVAHLTPDIVKIDGALVQRLMRTPSSFDRLLQLVANFRSDGVRVVLEGIEKSAHLTLAMKTGADFHQGFALAVPRLAPARFDEWFGADEAQPAHG